MLPGNGSRYRKGVMLSTLPDGTIHRETVYRVFRVGRKNYVFEGTKWVGYLSLNINPERYARSNEYNHLHGVSLLALDVSWEYHL